MNQSLFRFLRSGLGLLALWLLALWLLASPAAHACAVCFGNSQNDQTTSAISGAILFMLVLVVGMMAAFGGFAFYLYRMSCRSDQELDELAEAAFAANPDTAT